MAGGTALFLNLLSGLKPQQSPVENVMVNTTSPHQAGSLQPSYSRGLRQPGGSGADFTMGRAPELKSPVQEMNMKGQSGIAYQQPDIKSGAPAANFPVETRKKPAETLPAGSDISLLAFGSSSPDRGAGAGAGAGPGFYAIPHVFQGGLNRADSSIDPPGERVDPGGRGSTPIPIAEGVWCLVFFAGVFGYLKRRLVRG